MATTAALTDVLKEVRQMDTATADTDNERELLRRHSLGLRSVATNGDHKTSFVPSTDTQALQLHHSSGLYHSHRHFMDYLSYLFVFLLSFCFE